ncbi:hypothetical protein [Shinella sp. HZN7]|uniref:hypothetical protein n=1 Tax=Shinella sp. (strain HZN7) TaxID=879274 RepID=UPI00143AFD35|nr:hypothetical protein [Shinella sp. HZN7]
MFDTSLSEEGIVGRAVGMALAGLMPVPEIQFRNMPSPPPSRSTIAARSAGAPTTALLRRWCCACPAAISNAATLAQQTNEVAFVHQPGWKVAVPSNAADAVGCCAPAFAATIR